MDQAPDRLDPLRDRPHRDAHEVSDVAFWEERYRGREMPWDLGSAAPPLLRAVDAARGGGNAARRIPAAASVCVPGCGRGFEVLELAGRGFEATGFDFSPGAVDAARELAASRGVRASFEVCDIFSLPDTHAGQFDLVIEYTCFCAVHPSRRDDYAAVAHAILKPGGHFLGLFFPVHPDWQGGPPYRVLEADIHRHFSPHFEVLSVETPADSVGPRTGIERLVWLERRSNGELV